MKRLFKNWSKICEVGKVSKLFMIFLSSLELSEIQIVPADKGHNESQLDEIRKRSKRTEFAYKIAAALPDFFSDTLIRGPVPFSVIVAKLDENDEEYGYVNQPEDVCDDFDIPFIELGYMPNVLEAIEKEWVAGKVPENWFDDERFKKALKAVDKRLRDTPQIFEWNGVRLVLISHCEADSIGLIPLECVVLNL